ncbi:MAG: bifunctional ornithine acetyltransferase/N-acetylglutamate synthase [Pelagibacteraceae bacterium]|nr:bifunctional ornithine acetyltransferase/N-acetylglutamate synthase [Pelagibacteraceae bacterium]
MCGKKFECKAKEIYFSSTGVIGEYLKYSKINNEVERLNDKKEKLFINAARAIMTTDTFPKIAKRRIKLNNRIIDICGIAKGSGMIKPNMATMLAYIFIDAKVKKNALDEIISESAEDTFNSITVDGETSTNDSVLLFSLDNNQNNKTITKNHINYKRIKHNIRLIMEDLCKQIVMDGEGISKFVTINIRSAKNILQAKNIAFAIGNSPLVKTAIAGEDPNWGRVVAAIGKSGEKISADKLKIKFGKFEICKNGCVVKNYNEKKVKLYMRKNKIEISVDLGVGKISKKIWTTDLTKKYIDINADYRS